MLGSTCKRLTILFIRPNLILIMAVGIKTVCEHGACVCVCVSGVCLYICGYVCVLACVDVCACICVCMRVHVHVHVCVCVWKVFLTRRVAGNVSIAP